MNSKKRLSNIDLNTVSEVDITACAMHGTYDIVSVHDLIQCTPKFWDFINRCPTKYGPGHYRVTAMVVLDVIGTDIPSRNSRVVYPNFRIVVTPDDVLQPHRDKPLSHFIRSVVHRFKQEELERMGKERKYGWSP